VWKGMSGYGESSFFPLYGAVAMLCFSVMLFYELVVPTTTTEKRISEASPALSAVGQKALVAQL
jgi:hypothetical protein